MVQTRTIILEECHSDGFPTAGVFDYRFHVCGSFAYSADAFRRTKYASLHPWTGVSLPWDSCCDTRRGTGTGKAWWVLDSLLGLEYVVLEIWFGLDDGQ